MSFNNLDIGSVVLSINKNEQGNRIMGRKENGYFK